MASRFEALVVRARGHRVLPAVIVTASSPREALDRILGRESDAARRYMVGRLRSAERGFSLREVARLYRGRDMRKALNSLNRLLNRVQFEARSFRRGSG